jgi:Mrp family chromosome partitioning ATPase
VVTVQSFFAASNVLIVAGKGGVGKTTVGACLGFAAARAGYDVLLVELEGYSNLGAMLGLEPSGFEPVEVDRSHTGPGRLQLMQLRPDEALADYLDRSGLGPVIRRISRAGAVEVVVAAAPGIRDLVTMGKIRQMEQAGVADLIIVDAPASGHALSLLTSAAGMADSTTGGPIKEQADQVLELLGDETRCRVLLVTLPEDTPVSETIETAYAIEDRIGVKLGPVVVNGVWPPIQGLDVVGANGGGDGPTAGRRATMEQAARYRRAKVAGQQHQLERLSAELPLPQIRLPQLFTATIDTVAVSALADRLAAELDRHHGTG